MPTGLVAGGVIVLRKLGKLLEERGHDVKIFSYKDKDMVVKQSLPSLFFKRLKCLFIDYVRYLMVLFNLREYSIGSLLFFKEKIFPFVNKDTIVIYPEIVLGNPLHAQKVVRWFLYHNRFPNNPEAYSKEELFFSFREHFNDYKLNPTCRLLNIKHFNSDLYKQTNFGEHKGVCYIIRKGKSRNDLPQKFNGPIIDDLTEKEKVAVFNRCKYCYDYDTQTFYDTIACVCGCIPIVVMELGKTKADYMGKGDFDYGRAYGDTSKEIEYAIKTRPSRLKLLDFSDQNEKNVEFFLKEVEIFFGKHFPKG